VAQAFYHDARRPAVISTSARLTPVLAWDANINGGFLHDRFDHFGLIFEVDPSRRALAGLVAGARFSTELRLAYGLGRYLEVQANGEAAWSPRHKTGRANVGLSVCSRNHLAGWTFGDLCASTQTSRRALSSNRSAVVSGTLTHLFTAGPAYHQISFGLARHQQQEGQQNAATLGWGAVWNRLTTDLSLTLSPGIADEHALRRRIDAQASWIWGQRAYSLSLWQIDAHGGRLLGVDRRDRLRGLGLSSRLHRNIMVELTHQQTTSTHALFDERRTGVGMRIDLGR